MAAIHHDMERNMFSGIILASPKIPSMTDMQELPFALSLKLAYILGNLNAASPFLLLWNTLGGICNSLLCMAGSSRVARLSLEPGHMYPSPHAINDNCLLHDHVVDVRYLVT